MPSTISFPVQPCIHAGSMFKSYDEFAFPSLNPLFSAFSCRKGNIGLLYVKVHYMFAHIKYIHKENMLRMWELEFLQVQEYRPTKTHCLSQEGSLGGV